MDKDEKPSGSCLLQGLKMVLHSKELEGRFSHLKDVFLGLKVSQDFYQLLITTRNHGHHPSQASLSPQSLTYVSLTAPVESVEE